MINLDICSNFNEQDFNDLISGKKTIFNIKLKSREKLFKELYFDYNFREDNQDIYYFSFSKHADYIINMVSIKKKNKKTDSEYIIGLKSICISNIEEVFKTWLPDCKNLKREDGYCAHIKNKILFEPCENCSFANCLMQNSFLYSKEFQNFYEADGEVLVQEVHSLINEIKIQKFIKDTIKDCFKRDVEYDNPKTDLDISILTSLRTAYHKGYQDAMNFVIDYEESEYQRKSKELKEEYQKEIESIEKEDTSDED